MNEAEGARMEGMAREESKTVVNELLVFGVNGSFDDAVTAIGAIVE